MIVTSNIFLIWNLSVHDFLFSFLCFKTFAWLPILYLFYNSSAVNNKFACFYKWKPLTQAILECWPYEALSDELQQENIYYIIESNRDRENLEAIWET